MTKEINDYTEDIILFINGQKAAHGKERHIFPVLIDCLHPDAADTLKKIKKMRESTIIYKEKIYSSITPNKAITIYSEVFKFIC